ncbi:glycosyltransferase family 4 protein [Hymenobacter sp. BT18]|uniref:glycosyltransferase n=1 Tax=Hymenobacter sp. BT18 TaxID=2835648 RepID=UPI00143E771D|nr:glycosyltransferase [Hymenobacter sp. BT18]QIX60166.1 glycosyltransferase family 4 protein [Hymenobacter sp. BT18]
MPRLLFAVTTDLNYDQRMQRICGSLAGQGYTVLLVGRELPQSLPLTPQPYQQHRLSCWFTKGKLFYLEFTLRLLAYLLTQRAAVWCAIDLDTALPVWLRARLGGQPFVYDAHELFTEMPEVVRRPAVQWVWRQVEKFIVPRASLAYTVGPALAAVFRQRYGRTFEVIRNISRLTVEAAPPVPNNSLILYQGVLNEGRGLEALLEAMPNVRGQLVLCGEGDLSVELRARAAQLGLLASGKVSFRGYVLPAELRQLTRQARVGVLLLENRGLSYYYSLANKFFDYLHAGVPQVVIDFPEYRALNAQCPVADLVPDLQPAALAAALTRLLPGGDEAHYQELADNCRQVRTTLNWQQEEMHLLALYDALLPGQVPPTSTRNS